MVLLFSWVLHAIILLCCGLISISRVVSAESVSVNAFKFLLDRHWTDMGAQIGHQA
jgi:hypothetical protein